MHSSIKIVHPLVLTVHDSMTEQGMQALEKITNGAITEVNPANLLSYVNRVER